MLNINTPKKTLAEMWNCVFSGVGFWTNKKSVAMLHPMGAANNIHLWLHKNRVMAGSDFPSNKINAPCRATMTIIALAQHKMNAMKQFKIKVVVFMVCSLFNLPFQRRVLSHKAISQPANGCK